MTTKKRTKKCDARAESLFYESKPIAFLPFLLTSPSSLLKLPNRLYRTRTSVDDGARKLNNWLDQ